MKSLIHLKAAATAGSFSDWLNAKRHLIDERNQICPSHLMRDHTLAAEICWLSIRGGAGVRSELMRIFQTEAFRPSEADFANALNFLFYEVAFTSASEALEGNKWQRFTAILLLLVSLPSPSHERSTEITHLITRFVENVESAQITMMAQFPLVSYPLPSTGHIWRETSSATQPFIQLNAVLDVFTANINYLQLSSAYISLLLARADWPVLTHLSSKALALTSTPLGIGPAVLSSAVQQWSRRITLLDPDPFAAGETD
jgi:hypothetical protein